MTSGTVVAIARGVTALLFFVATAVVVALFMSNAWYAALFSGIGIVAGATEFSLGMNPAKVALIRRVTHVILASGLVVLAVSLGINFQFHQMVLDFLKGVVTGAAIQFVAARVVLPFIFGNMFCSRVCWDGIAFDLAVAARGRGSSSKPALGGRNWTAWVYLAFSILAAILVGAAFSAESVHESARWRFGVENALIIFFGLTVLPRMGGRSYCRQLCPFITVSGFFAKFSLFKITPVDEVECDGCGACSAACPMGIDVRGATIGGERLSHPNCLLCESCVQACAKRRLRMSIPRSILRVFAKKGTDQ